MAFEVKISMDINKVEDGVKQDFATYTLVYANMDLADVVMVEEIGVGLVNDLLAIGKAQLAEKIAAGTEVAAGT